jgi:hypothetical protein
MKGIEGNPFALPRHQALLVSGGIVQLASAPWMIGPDALPQVQPAMADALHPE